MSVCLWLGRHPEIAYQFRMFLQGLRRVLGAAALAAGFAVCGQEPELRSGIAAEFSAAGRSDWTVLPNLALHLPKGEAPTPFFG